MLLHIPAQQLYDTILPLLNHLVKCPSLLHTYLLSQFVQLHIPAQQLSDTTLPLLGNSLFYSSPPLFHTSLQLIIVIDMRFLFSFVLPFLLVPLLTYYFAHQVHESDLVVVGRFPVHLPAVFATLPCFF